jgi:sugar/nucleoside kinase (ribokinase family)
MSSSLSLMGGGAMTSTSRGAAVPDGFEGPPAAASEDPCAERDLVRDWIHGAADGLDVFLSGQVFMDMIFTGLPGLPPPGTELVTDELGSAPGGIANIAVAMSRLGLRVGLATAMGDDLFGAYLWRTLAEQEGIDLSRSHRLPGWPTPVTVSLAYDSDRSMVTYTRPSSVPPEDTVRVPPPARVCFVDVARPVPSWAQAMRREGAMVFADTGWDPTETWSAEVLDRLGQVDVFLPNAVEAMAYTRTDSPEAALRALSARVPVVVVKLGAEGAMAVDSATGRRACAPALPVPVLDPTGAGDVFAAGFVFATLSDWPLAQCLSFANLCAGLSVRHHSGSLGAPCWGEIAAFGESEDVPPEVLARYGFVVPHIPEAELDRGLQHVTRAQPTLRESVRPARA